MARDLQLLKEVLSVPTHTYQEDLMVQFIVDWLKSNNIEHYVDEHLNVYAIKQTGELPEDFVFPCVIAHTDTVHELDTINVREEMLPNTEGELKLSLKAYNDSGNPTGIGGDDKCGVFACFELLKELPNLKAALFDQMVSKRQGIKPVVNNGPRTAKPGAAGRVSTTTEGTRAKQRLAKTGRIDDAASAIEHLLK